MSLPTLFGEFRVVADPELRFAPSGTAVATIRLAANSRKKEGDQWVDDKKLFIRATAFNRLAENIVESFGQGDLVEARGRIQTEEWERDGEKHQAVGFILDSLAPSLAYATARPSKNERRESGGASAPAAAAAPATDPWATTAQGEEPPF